MKYKLIIEVPGKTWAVVNVHNIREKYEFFSRAHAVQFLEKLNHN